MPAPRADLEDVLMVVKQEGDPTVAARRLGISVSGVAERLYRNGYTDLALPYWRLVGKQRRGTDGPDYRTADPRRTSQHRGSDGRFKRAEVR